MRNTIIVLLLVCCVTFLYAQDTISGTVYLGDSDSPAIGATVRVEGTDRGAITDVNGDFTIEAEQGETLIVSYVGYDTETQIVDGSPLTFSLLAGNELDDIVITALGIEKEKKALGYAVSEVSEEQIKSSSQENIVDVLQGQTTGALISQTGGGPGQSSRIVVRGIGSFNGDGQPLFVVDGVPMSNNSFTVGGGSSRNVSNRAVDINPNDIESVSLLKGGAATALYGARAADGAVIITTKKGKAGQTSMNVSLSTGWEEINKYPETQTVYTQGYEGVYDAESFWPTWGPTVQEARNLDPNHRPTLFNNFENAYQTGKNHSANISFSGGSEKSTFLLSGGYVDQEGTIPFSTFERLNVKARGALELTPKFDVSASAEFVNSGGDRVDADAFNTRLVYWAPQQDVTNFQRPDGTMRPYRLQSNTGNNPIYGAKTNKFTDDVNRLIASTSLGYDLTDWMKLNYRFSVDHYSDFRLATAPAPRGIENEAIFENNGLGYVTETPIDNTWLNSNAFVTIDKSFQDIGLTFTGGTEAYSSKYKRITTNGSELDVWNLFSLNNAKEITTSSYEEESRVVGVYGDLSLDYLEKIFLGLTARNDWNSTLPKNDRTSFYPSASLSYIASEDLNLPTSFDYLKLRSSYASTARNLTPYLTNQYFFSDTSFPFTNSQGNLVTGWTRQNSKSAPDLQPERTRTFDIGTDISMFNNRLGVDFTWYKMNTIDIITPIPVTTSTGYSSFSGNAGEIENTGVELGLSGTPLINDDWQIDLNVNFTTNNGEVIDIREGVESFPYGSWYGYAGSTAYMRFEPGLPYGNIYGTTWKRLGDEDDLYVDTSKPMVIGADGFPVIGDEKIIGNSQPDWFGSLNTSIRWKNLQLSALFDTRQGSNKYNQQGNFFAAFGTAPYTLDRNDLKVFDGVLADGSPNTQEVWLGQGVGPDGRSYGAGYYRNTYRGVTEAFVEDADWFRLRNLNLTYNLPKSILQNVFEQASVSVIGYNLWLSTDYSGFDPEGSGVDPSSSIADGFSGFTYPNSRSVSLRLNVTPF